jgi:DNA polymerase III gamma/tau subunit
LKLLEEPPAGTLLILTAANHDDLLPTVVSRTQRITINRPTLADSLEYFSAYPKPAVDSAWRLSQGSAGLLSALLSEAADHPLKIAVEQTKGFISQTTYQRLISLQKLAKDKAEFAMFLDGLAKVLGARHAQSLANNRPNADKILRSRQAVEQALKSLRTNANTRLVSLRLALNIPL